MDKIRSYNSSLRIRNLADKRPNALQKRNDPPARPWRSRLSGHSLRIRLLIGLEPRINVAGEQFEIVDGLCVGQEARLPHHQEIAHAAAMFAERRDLLIDVVRRAAEQD